METHVRKKKEKKTQKKEKIRTSNLSRLVSQSNEAPPRKNPMAVTASHQARATFWTHHLRASAGRHTIDKMK